MKELHIVLSSILLLLLHWLCFNSSLPYPLSSNITASNYNIAESNNAATPDFATVHILYPYSKEKRTLNLFFNKQMVKTVRDGERLVYNISTEGLLKITLLDRAIYSEPSTLAKNTRSISLNKGKDYFFEINGNSELNYIPNTVRGKEKFNSSSDFSSEPKQISDRTIDSLILR